MFRLLQTLSRSGYSEQEHLRILPCGQSNVSIRPGGQKRCHAHSFSLSPARRLSDLVPPEESAQPAFKIMRRNNQARPKRHDSQPGSVAGDDADLSDIEPSETSSVGGRSSTAGTGTRRHMTIAEREAAYQEARSRIFMDFEEKAKEQENQMSANSSTFSLVSGSGSASGGRRSSIGDVDDSASSVVPTESEWSGPVNRDRRDNRRGASTASSSRSLLSSGASYNTNNGSGSSSRNSRATSPSFAYPTLYEPPAIDTNQYGPPPPPSGYVFYPPYVPQPGQAPGPPYMPPYPYYPQYGYPPHPPPPQHPSESPNHATPDAGYSPQHPTQPNMAYSYMWPPPPPGQPSHQPQHLTQMPANIPPTMSGPYSAPGPSGQVQPYAGYVPPPQPQYSPYPPQGYPPPFAYPQAPPLGVSPQQIPLHSSMYSPEITRTTSEMGHYANGSSNGVDGNDHSRASSRNSGNHHGGPGAIGGKRGAPKTRAAWSFGPGAGMGGYAYNMPPNAPMVSTDTVGPRLSSAIRRTSGASSTSGSAGTRTPGDEASSTAVSRHS